MSKVVQLHFGMSKFNCKKGNANTVDKKPELLYIRTTIGWSYRTVVGSSSHIFSIVGRVYGTPWRC